MSDIIIFMNVVQVKSLSKKFGKFTAVDNLNFAVTKGEFVGLLGPNGAGKTTTVQMLLGMIEPTYGDILMFGKNMKKNRSEILKKVNFSASYAKLPYFLTVDEILSVFSKLYEVRDAKNKISNLLDLFQVSHLRKSKGGDLSSGERARIVLCKALLNDPEIIFLDEPTSSLDPDIAVTVRQYLRQVQKEKQTTIFMTSHNMSEVEELCSRVIFISNGKVVDEDTPEELAKKITKTRITMMMKDGLKRTRKIALKNSWEVLVEDRYITITIKEDKIAFFLSKLAEKGIRYSEISIEKPKLEDYFLAIAKKQTKRTKENKDIL